jgi:basic membrane protein A and related proteins
MHSATALRPVALLTILLAGLALGTGCRKKKKPAPAEPESTEQAADEPQDRRLVVGFIYGGSKNDDGINQAYAAGAAAVARMGGVRILELENVGPQAVASSIDKLVALSGASVVFATGGDHLSPLMDGARRFPKVTFRGFAARYEEGLNPPNAGTLQGYADEPLYVAGVVAGMTTKTRKLGFVAGRAVPYVLRGINAFTLGARSVNPRATTTVIFTNEWTQPAAEAKAVATLAAAKVDVMATFVDAPATALQAAEQRGLLSIGIHTDGSRFAPNGHLVSVLWNWQALCTEAVSAVRDGKPPIRSASGGLAEGVVSLSELGAKVPPPVREKALAIKQQLATGKLTIFRGPVKNNRGKVFIPAGTDMPSKDARLDAMGDLVEGVVGQLPD